jgi:hypothetical protein
MKEFKDVRVAYGESDEFSFVLQKASSLFGEWSAAPGAAVTPVQQHAASPAFGPLNW